MARVVREPIQVYLSPEERADLDRAARMLGVSRSEVLRRGISAVGGPVRYGGHLRDLVEEGHLTPSTIPPGRPPASRPVAPWEEVMAELDRDRSDR